MATFNCFLDWKSSRLEVARQSYPGAALAFLSRCVTWTCSTPEELGPKSKKERFSGSDDLI